MKQHTCESRVEAHLESRIADLRRLWKAYCNGQETDEELGSIHEYGLCFDYVATGTFSDQREGYFRYQLSTGGPGDEFRFYADAQRKVHRIEYWFLDWFDGACRELTGEDENLLLEIWDWFEEGGSVEAVLREA
ncbi:MAG: hypothetical protein PHV74_13785 [Dehalococcoidia bacterium]|nr:hypothetical protein [Dehalococcoidia bacterium]